MAKLTKAHAKAHAEASALVALDRPLTHDEREFVFNNWREDAEHVNSTAGAFFTPLDLAMEFAMEAGGHRIIDLCAGIGALSYGLVGYHMFGPAPEIVCIEVNPAYVAVGRRLVPEATWICTDVLGALEMGLGRFDVAVSNPPFGKIKRSGNGPRYRGADFEFHVIDIASQMARWGAFILPHMAAGFEYSGRRQFTRHTDGRAVDFQKLTGLHFEAGAGHDLSVYRRSWRGVSPACEIVTVEFPEPATAVQADMFEEAA